MSEPFVLDAKPMLPDEMISALLSGNPTLDEYLGTEIYANHDPAYLALQRERMVETVRLHQQRGRQPAHITCFERRDA